MKIKAKRGHARENGCPQAKGERPGDISNTLTNFRNMEKYLRTLLKKDASSSCIKPFSATPRETLEGYKLLTDSIQVMIDQHSFWIVITIAICENLTSVRFLELPSVHLTWDLEALGTWISFSKDVPAGRFRWPLSESVCSDMD